MVVIMFHLIKAFTCCLLPALLVSVSNVGHIQPVCQAWCMGRLETTAFYRVQLVDV